MAAEKARNGVGKAPGNCQSKDAMELASEVAQKVELEQVLLKECFARHDPGQSGEELSVEMRVDAEARAGVDRIVASVRVGVEAVPKGGAGTEHIVEVTCEFELIYAHPEPAKIAGEKLAAFAKLNAVYNAWPYVRELIQNTTSRMGIIPLVVPVFRL